MNFFGICAYFDEPTGWSNPAWLERAAEGSLHLADTLYDTQFKYGERHMTAPAANTPSRFASHASHVTTTHQQVTRVEDLQAARGLASTWPRCVRSLHADEASGWRPAKSRGRYQSARQIRGRERSAKEAAVAPASGATAESEISQVGMRKWRVEDCVCRYLARREKMSSAFFRHANEGQTQQ